jgi:hypothetical protein
MLLVQATLHARVQGLVPCDVQTAPHAKKTHGQTDGHANSTVQVATIQKCMTMNFKLKFGLIGNSFDHACFLRLRIRPVPLVGKPSWKHAYETRQGMHVSCSVTRSRVTVTQLWVDKHYYILRVCVCVCVPALDIRHAKHIPSVHGHVVMCGQYWLTISSQLEGGSNMTGTNCDLFTHNQSRSYLNHLVPHKRHDLRKKFLNIKYVFQFSLQLLSETFIILRIIQRDIINLYGSSHKVPDIHSKTWIF